MCGESQVSSFSLLWPQGSPPHVWGKLMYPPTIILLIGITPTCVGKAPRHSSHYRGEKDHPHMCGESQVSSFSLLWPQGSPPHVWGKPTCGLEKQLVMRITPTCVGKAQNGVSGAWEHRDHPHMCGESPAFKCVLHKSVGSPPHVWGKLGCYFGFDSFCRITPTCVGKASLCLLSTVCLWDHPHMCGESTTGTWQTASGKGSPPHVWGKHIAFEEKGIEARITPTCVGKAAGQRAVLQV